jgi:hypothetical protein
MNYKLIGEYDLCSSSEQCFTEITYELVLWHSIYFLSLFYQTKIKLPILVNSFRTCAGGTE